jgi:putative membrane protein
MNEEWSGAEPSDVRATDVLANERTFLAYIRTSLSFIAFGFVVARFGLFVEEISAFTHVKGQGPHYSTIFGITMAVVGIAIGLLGVQRYVGSDRALRKGMVTSLPRAMAYVVTIAVAAIGFVVAIFLSNFR